MKIRFIDTHAHMDFKDYESHLDEILHRSNAVGVEKIIIPGVSIKDINKILNLIDKYPFLYGAVALHPSEASEWDKNSYKKLKEYASHPKIVAIGETGLDYYWDKSFIDLQKEVFREHIRLAKELNKPLIIHNRDAHSDVIAILKETQANKGVMHCFSGSSEFAKECCEFGLFIALGGPVTFKNAKLPKEVAKIISLEKLLLETDSPFLTPHPFRGKVNDPSNLPLIAEEIAKIKETSVEEIAKITSQNAEFLFGL